MYYYKYRDMGSREIDVNARTDGQRTYAKLNVSTASCCWRSGIRADLGQTEQSRNGRHKAGLQSGRRDDCEWVDRALVAYSECQPVPADDDIFRRLTRRSTGTRPPSRSRCQSPWSDLNTQHARRISYEVRQSGSCGRWGRCSNKLLDPQSKFTIMRNDRSFGRGDGVCVFVHNSHTVSFFWAK